ncbi:MAG: hypothetical protein V4582_24945 [Pseudomonadota bacterium]
MPTLPVDVSSLTLNLAQWRGQALASLFSPAAPNWTPILDSMPGGAAKAQPDTLSFSGVLDQFSAALNGTALATPTKPSGLDSTQPFSTPGQNMVTVLNRVEVSFKAQFSELGEMRTSLSDEQALAQKLGALDTQTSDADIATALDNFVASYNAGVQRFAPDVAAGGILEGSQEAARARFATERDIAYILTGSEAGLKGGLASLGISTDPKTGLAAIDHTQLADALAKNKNVDLVALHDFATSFSATIATLNAPDHAQQRQMANLERAVHWIDTNKDAVQKEFGAGAAATPDEAFSKAAAHYDEMAKLLGRT